MQMYTVRLIFVVGYLLIGLGLCVTDMRSPHSVVVGSMRKNVPFSLVYSTLVFCLTVLISPIVWCWALGAAKLRKWRRD